MPRERRYLRRFPEARENKVESTLPPGLASQQPCLAALRGGTERSGNRLHGTRGPGGWQESDPVGWKPATIKGTEANSNGVEVMEERPYGLFGAETHPPWRHRGRPAGDTPRFGTAPAFRLRHELAF